MNEFEKDVIDRLARLETKSDTMDNKLDKHLERHYQVSVRSLFAVIGAVTSLLISIFK